MSQISTAIHLRRASRAVPSFTTPLAASFAAAALLALSGCSDVPDPADYGGGVEGRAIAQCIERTEREDVDLTREEVGALCGCLTERIAGGTEEAMGTGTVNRAEMDRAMGRCAEEEGIAL